MKQVKTRRWLMVTALLLSFCLGPGTVQAANNNILFILDASGSMAQTFGEQTKMQAAKQVFGNLLADLPAGMNVGLEVYGHHGDKDCSVIEVMNPVAPLDAASISANVQGLTPTRGATPMAAALEQGAEALSAAMGDKVIVLISDGEETCGGDPAAMAQKLTAEGIGIKTHVVGLGVNEAEKAQLSGIAAAGGGKYYAANNADELKSSLAEIRETVVEKTPTVVFEDEFDNEFLSDEWTIVNADEDNILVEDGQLLVVLQPGWPSDNETHNMLLYSGDLPRNYEITAKFTANIEDFPTRGGPESQRVGLVLYAGEGKFMEMTTASAGFAGFAQNEIQGSFGKYQNGEWLPGYSAKITTIGSDEWSYTGSFEFRIQKNNRKYTALFKDAEGNWIEIGSFTDLKGKYKPGIMAYRAPDAAETMAEYDWFRIVETD